MTTVLAGRELAMAVVSALGEVCTVVPSGRPPIVKASELSGASTEPHVKLLRECTIWLMPFLCLSLS